MSKMIMLDAGKLATILNAALLNSTQYKRATEGTLLWCEKDETLLEMGKLLLTEIEEHLMKKQVAPFIRIGDKIEIEGMQGEVIYITSIEANGRQLALSAGNIYVAECYEKKTDSGIVYQHIRKFDNHLIHCGYVKLLDRE